MVEVKLIEAEYNFCGNMWQKKGEFKSSKVIHVSMDPIASNKKLRQNSMRL